MPFAPRDSHEKARLLVQSFRIKPRVSWKATLTSVPGMERSASLRILLWRHFEGEGAGCSRNSRAWGLVFRGLGTKISQHLGKRQVHYALKRAL